MKLYRKSELKDSRVFFDKAPPRFLSIFIIFVLILILLSITISMYLVKPYIVKAQGVITTTDNTYQSVNTNGYVLEIKAKEGQQVAEGDVLFTLSNGQEGIQDQAILEQMDSLNSRISIMDKYETSLNMKQNLLQNSGIEQEYYGKIEYYLSQLESESYNSNNTQSSLDEKNSKKQTLEMEINNLQLQLNELDNNEENLEKRSTIESEIDVKKSELKSIDEEIKQLQQQINDPTSQSEQVYAQMVSELGTSRTELTSKLVELEGQLSIAEGQSNLLSVQATSDGYVHYLTVLKVGMSVQQNQVVAEISMNEKNQLIVEAYIEATDISKASIGDDVNIALNGVNSQKYGTLKGKLMFIDSGTISQETQQGNILFYKCHIELKETKLMASDKSEIQAMKSMPIEARIVYEKETYFEWMLEMLSFKN